MQHQHARTFGTGDVRPATKAALDFEQNLVKRGKKVLVWVVGRCLHNDNRGLGLIVLYLHRVCEGDRTTNFSDPYGPLTTQHLTAPPVTSSCGAATSSFPR